MRMSTWLGIEFFTDQQERECTYNVIMRRVRETIVTEEKQWALHNLSECTCSLRYPACNAHALYCHLWPARLYYFFAHYLLNDKILEKKSYWTQNVFWFSLQLLSETFLILRRNERDMIKRYINPLKMKRRLLYLKTQSVPRCKHFSSRL